MKLVAFKLNCVLSMLSIAYSQPFWSGESGEYSEISEDYQGVDENSEENSFERYDKYHDDPLPEQNAFERGFGSMFNRNRFDDNYQYNRFEGSDEQDENNNGGNYYARDEGFPSRYSPTRGRGSEYRALKRRPTGRVRPSNSRIRTRDYSQGSGENSNFGNGDYNKNVFHITKKIVYV